MSTAEDPRKLIYPETYIGAMAPAGLRLALLSRGVSVEWPRPLRYLELGFGSGLSLNVHAAANDGEFWGNDFVRAHVDGAASIASISGADVRVLVDSFADLLRRDDLPAFDIIAAHGIWTWVPDGDRAAIVTLLERKLKPGGVFYVSYNNTAGWSSVVYLRQLMNLFRAEAGGGDISQAVAFARSLQSAGAPYFKENPAAAAELSAMAGRDPVYLQQEYFLEDWKLMSLAEIAHALAPAGLAFGAQLPLIAHDDELVLGPAARHLVSTLPTPMLRETVRECFQGMGFRQDIFVKQPTPLTASERRDQFRSQSFLLTTRPGNVMMQGGSPWGPLDLAAKGCSPVLDALAERGPSSIAALEQALPAIAIDDLISRVVLLAAVNVVQPMLPPEEQSIAAPRCHALNTHILRLPSETGAVLASPVLGTGVRISQIEKAFLAAFSAGKRTMPEWANALAQTAEAELGGRSADDVAARIEADTLPFYRAMGLVQD